MPRGETQLTKYRKALIANWAEENAPVTVRQIFYRLSTQDAIPKSENGYKTVVRLCSKMRRDGEIPFEYFADNTRWQRRPRTYDSLTDAIALTAETYRRSMWQNQNGLVEIWCEKEALAGVIYEVTSRWDVPLMVVRGYPSLSFVHGAAQELLASTKKGKESHLFYLGDHDPSGVDIPRKIKEDLHEFAPGARWTFDRVAVTREQIAAWDLPSRPTKKSDSRAKNWEGDSTELDAIEPDRLRSLVENCITSIINTHELESTLRIERLEKQSVPSVLAELQSKTGLEPL